MDRFNAFLQQLPQILAAMPKPTPGDAKKPLASLVAAFVLYSYYKVLPGSYTFRAFKTLYDIVIARRHELPTPAHIFSPYVRPARVFPSDLDFNMHKSNTTYLLDVDFSREDIVMHLFKGAIQKRYMRGQEQTMYIVAGLHSYFWRELRAWERYEMTSRFLAWEGGTMYIVTHFTVEDKEAKKRGEEKRIICATAVSECVCKRYGKRERISDIMFEAGLLPEGWDAVVEKGVEWQQMSRDRAQRVLKAEFDKVSRPRRKKRTKAEEGKSEEDEVWTLEKIEEERRRGMEVLKAITLVSGGKSLKEEYRDGSEEGLVNIAKLSAKL